MNSYKYIGDGAGVPGLPHEIPEDEAAQYGQPLQDAIAAGLYKSVGAQGIAPASPDIEPPKRKSKAADTAAEGD